jgi:ATP-dependent DNA ligase
MKASRRAEFIEPMECLPVTTVPEGVRPWLYEIKLDGYRAEAVKSHDKVTLYSRRKNVLNNKRSVAERTALPTVSTIQ